MSKQERREVPPESGWDALEVFLDELRVSRRKRRKTLGMSSLPSCYLPPGVEPRPNLFKTNGQ